MSLDGPVQSAPRPQDAAAPASSAGHARRVVQYYDRSWFDYRLLWVNRRSRAMHFGAEAQGARGHTGSVLAANRMMAEAVGLRRGERVLDAGCGIGGSSIWLASTYGARVTGVNIVASQIARARQQARRLRVPESPRFEVADFTATPLAANSVDVVWAQESACHSPQKPAFLREAARVLDDGGRIVLSEYVRVTDAPSPVIDDWCANWEMSLATASEWRGWLEATGFTDITMRNITARMHRSLRRLWRLCSTLEPGADLLHAIGLRSDAQQRNLRGGLAMWHALHEGDWRYALITAALPPGRSRR